jgi:nitrite reductase (cytochrome c-552)
MTETPTTPRGRTAAYLLAVVVTAGATVGVMLLLGNITKRKLEARENVFRLVDLTEATVDPAEWGKNFPRQYDGYMRTADNERTRFGGSESLPRPGGGTQAVQKLDVDPRLRTIFAGYAFSIDYRERRGHAYMLSDQRETERVIQRPQPGSCLHCHASTVVAYRRVGLQQGAPGSLDDPLLSEAGQAQLFSGFEAVCGMRYDDATTLVDHPVSCLDCHDPDSMRLRITRPGFIRGIQALAAGPEPTPHLPSIEQWRKGDRRSPYDPNTDATRQEMRSMACAQCHVEYYFKGDGKIVTYPWANGLKVEQIERYYDDLGFSDWTHAESGAKVLKAQHPEFEVWSQGVHARAGVACADCHMPYTRQGAIKISDHQVRSPMLNVARACQACHPWPEQEIHERVRIIQDRTFALLGRAEDATVSLIHAIKAARQAGAGDEALAPARALQRKAQWRTDFINAENSMGFHAPQEVARILAEAIDYARQGELAIARLGAAAPHGAAAGSAAGAISAGAAQHAVAGVMPPSVDRAHSAASMAPDSGDGE